MVGEGWESWDSCGGFVDNLVLLLVDCQLCLESCVCTLFSCALFHMSWLGMVGNCGNRAVDSLFHMICNGWGWLGIVEHCAVDL